MMEDTRWGANRDLPSPLLPCILLARAAWGANRDLPSPPFAFILLACAGSTNGCGLGGGS